MDNLLCLDQWKFTACCSSNHKIQEQLTRCAQAMGNNQCQKVIGNHDRPSAQACCEGEGFGLTLSQSVVL